MGAGKLLEVPPVVAGSRELGYPPSTVFPIGVILLLCVVAYAIPRTSVPGALLPGRENGGSDHGHLATQTLRPSE